MISASKTTKRPYEFRLREHGLRSIDALLGRALRENRSQAETEGLHESLMDKFRIEYRVDCSDASIRTYNSVEDIVAFPNVRTRKIERIRASTEGYIGTSLRIEFRDDRGATYDISGDEKSVLYYADEADKLLDSMRPWYWIIYRDYIWFGVFAILTVLGNVWLAPLVFAEASPDTLSNRAALGGAISTILAGVFLVLAIARGLALPRNVFLIGEGISRNRLRENCLYTVFVLIFLAGIVNWVVNKMG
jgi:hypothetical protein